MAALGTVAQPTVEVEPEGQFVTFTQVAGADTYHISVFPETGAATATYNVEDDAQEVVITRVPGTGSTVQKINLVASGVNTDKKFVVSILAHDSTAVSTDSAAESTASVAFAIAEPLGAVAGTSGEVAHRTTNEFTGAAYVSAAQTKGQVTYSRVNGLPSATYDDATSLEGATAAARDTADLPNTDMQQTIIRDEGNTSTSAGVEGGGTTLVSDIVVTPTDPTTASSVIVNPVTGAMTPITGTEQVTRGFDANTVRTDRLLHEIDNTKSYVDKSGVAH